MYNILIGWGIFVLLVYIFMWTENAYYKYDFPKLYKKILDIFTEEE